MRDIEAPNHLLKLFEAGIAVALLDEDTHSSDEWNGTPMGQQWTEQFQNYHMAT